MRTLHYRADTIISGIEQIAKEKDHIKSSLKNCGYPDWAFLKVTKKKGQEQQQPNYQSGHSVKTRVTIPFVSEILERVKKHLKAHVIEASFKPGNSLRSKLVHVKDKQSKEKRSNLVYGIVCAGNDCNETYVGKTKQALKSRAYQHKNPSSNEAQNSAVYLHLRETGHTINTKNATILDKEEHYNRSGIKEAIWERVESPLLNKKGGLRYNLSHAWDSTIKQIPRRLLSHDQNSGSVAWCAMVSHEMLLQKCKFQ